MGYQHGRLLSQALNTTIFACAILAALVGFSLSETALAAKTGPSVKKTKFIVGLERKVNYHVKSLAKPNRVVVEIEGSRLHLPEPPRSGPVGVVSNFHGGRVDKNRAKVVIEVTEPVIVEKSAIEKVDGGYHLTLDLVSVAQLRPARSLAGAPFDPPSGLGAAGIQPPMPRAIASQDDLDKRFAKPVIVLDPGHGGHDSGARKNGAVEKDVVLKFSHVLRKKLERTGRYKILMTRDKDEFISLGERRAFAERHNAQLFIAIHADYARASASGAAIFSLRDSVARKLKGSALRKARKVRVSKNHSAPLDNRDKDVVEDILADLGQDEARTTKDRSDLFSRSIIRHMGAKTKFRKRPHRTAAFKVLKTHLVPSVLIELAFVTNKSDAKRLKSQAWREKTAAGIVEAIDSYFSSKGAQLPMLAGVN